ncbi:adenosylcobinamide-GDP ribazoletransferase [Chloroflexota bacterium]
MSFFAALQFLTIIPLPWQREGSPEQLGRSTTYFPIVGLIIGLVLVGMNWMLNLVLPPAVVNVLLIAVLVIITGSLHLDGLVDTCDGLGGYKPVEDRWRVMRDSRAGAFGIVGVALLLLVKYVSLNSIPPFLMMGTLLFVPVVSRWAMVYAIFVYPYAHQEGLGTGPKQKTRWPQFTIATIITFIIALVLFPLFSITGLLMILVVWIVTTIFAFYLKCKFSGLTGDTYGAINEVAEVTALILASLLAHIGPGYTM